MKRTTNYILWIVVLAAMTLLIVLWQSSPPEPTLFSQTQFLGELRGSNIVKGIIVHNARKPFLQEIRGDYLSMESGHQIKKPFTTRVRFTHRLEAEVLGTGLFEVQEKSRFLPLP